jgi:hypothetical protein
VKGIHEILRVALPGAERGESVPTRALPSHLLRTLEAIDGLTARLEDYRTALRTKRNSDFDELKVCDAIFALFDDGDVAGRREAILDENRWDEDGNPLSESEDTRSLATWIMDRRHGE